MRAFVYLRQSLDRDGSGTAVERQRQDCRKLCTERGWEIVHEYVDNDASATSTKPRPQYQKMLAAVRHGGADVIVAWHVDRLTRKLIELEELIELSNEHNIKVLTATGDLDLSNDAGRLVGRILASVARGEVERKGARQKRAHEQAAEAGKPPRGGMRLFGFEQNGVDHVPVEADAVRKAYATTLAGGSLKSIARDWNDRGLLTTQGNPQNHSTVRRVLQNPRMAGLRKYRGEIIGEGAWEPIVERQTWDDVQTLLKLPSRRTTDSTARKWLLAGIALCGKCGATMATGHNPTRKTRGKRVYVCRKSKCISRKAEPVDDFVTGVVVDLLSRPDAADVFRTDRSDHLGQLRVEVASLRERRDDMALGIEQGLFRLESVRERLVRLNEQIDELDDQIASVASMDALSAMLDTDDVAATWEAADLHQKRAVIGRIMTITLHSPKHGRQQFDPATVEITPKHH